MSGKVMPVGGKKEIGKRSPFSGDTRVCFCNWCGQDYRK